MREIKFRAWDKNRKKMAKVYTFAFKECDCCKDENPMELAAVHYADGGGVYLDRDDCEVMQYTGLKDKNGVEIYEGDVVGTYIDKENTNYGDPSHWVQIIKWSDEEVGWRIWEKMVKCNPQMKEYEDCWAEQLFPKDEIVKMEVIGNIYENPELLK